jgi:carboxyl-terminal processing protease
MGMLEGEEGTFVRITVSEAGKGIRPPLQFRRRPLFLPSVTADLVDGDIGLIKIHFFQETTLQEFDAKLKELTRFNVRALILDLRGNPGGLLDVAIEVARRFLPNGAIIVSQVHHDPKQTQTFRSQNMMPLTIPLVVLVDADTASAAEVLAGALKENKRARLVGQTTYGKGCAQGLLKLPQEGALQSPATPSKGPGTGAIRITVARFISPAGQPYSGRGVEPDFPADSGKMQDDYARQEARQMLTMQ